MKKSCSLSYENGHTAGKKEKQKMSRVPGYFNGRVTPINSLSFFFFFGGGELKELSSDLQSIQWNQGQGNGWFWPYGGADLRWHNNTNK